MCDVTAYKIDSSTLVFEPFVPKTVTVKALVNGAPDVYLEHDLWYLARDKIWWGLTKPGFAEERSTLELAVKRMQGVSVEIMEGFVYNDGSPYGFELMWKFNEQDARSCLEADRKWTALPCYDSIKRSGL